MVTGRAQFAGVGISGLHRYHNTVLVREVYRADWGQYCLGLENQALGGVLGEPLERVFGEHRV